MTPGEQVQVLGEELYSQIEHLVQLGQGKFLAFPLTGSCVKVQY